MSKIITVICIPTLTIFSCNNSNKHPETVSNLDTTNNAVTSNKTDLSRYSITTDSIIFTDKTGDSLIYSKQEFNHMVDDHPELFSEHTEDPDLTYHSLIVKNGFANEVGEDAYYMLYAHFLQQRNNISNYDERRNTLIDIYQNINALFQELEHGGTYFGHMARRISGYAEYSIYKYRLLEKYFSKTYSINKQKELYIKMLRQLIADECNTDEEFSIQQKLERQNDLNKIVDKISTGITDLFTLHEAQEFHFSHYQYN